MSTEDPPRHWWELRESELSEGMPLMGRVWTPIGMIVAYTSICFGIPLYLDSIREQLIEARPVLEKLLHLFTSLRVYAQVVNAVFIVYYCYQSSYSWFCQPVPVPSSPYSKKMMWALWFYHILKCTDLLDSIIILHTRLTINKLQVFHHGSLVLVSWLGVKYLPGGSTALPVVTNLMSGAGFFFYHQLHKTLPAKDYNYVQALYAFQAIQFVIVIAHSTIVLFQYNCPYPAVASFAILAYVLSIVLFINFYLKFSIWQIVFHNAYHKHADEDEDDDEDNEDEDDDKGDNSRN